MGVVYECGSLACTDAVHAVVHAVVDYTNTTIWELSTSVGH